MAVIGEAQLLWRVCGEAERLKGLDPNHELLRLFYRTDDAVWDEFQGRFQQFNQARAEAEELAPPLSFWEWYGNLLQDAYKALQPA